MWVPALTGCGKAGTEETWRYERNGGASTVEGRRLRAVAVRHLLQEDRNVAVPALRFADLRRPAVGIYLPPRLDAELAYAVPPRQFHQRDCYDRVSAHQFFDDGGGGASRGRRPFAGAALVHHCDHDLRPW